MAKHSITVNHKIRKESKQYTFLNREKKSPYIKSFEWQSNVPPKIKLNLINWAVCFRPSSSSTDEDNNRSSLLESFPSISTLVDTDYNTWKERRMQMRTTLMYMNWELYVTCPFSCDCFRETCHSKAILEWQGTIKSLYKNDRSWKCQPVKRLEANEHFKKKKILKLYVAMTWTRTCCDIFYLIRTVVVFGFYKVWGCHRSTAK